MSFVDKAQQEKEKFDPHIEQFPEIHDFSCNGTNLKYHLNQQTKKPRAVLVCFHAYGKHGGYYGYESKIVSQKIKDINIAALDFKNFGRSDSPNRGMIATFDELIEHTEGFIEMLWKKYDKPKIFIQGLSLGGAICFNTAVRNKNNLISGLIMLSPGLRGINTSFLMKKIALAIAFFRPNTGVQPVSYIRQTRYNLQHVFANDPHVYNGSFLAGSASNAL